MKNLFLIVLLVFSINVKAQPPSDSYYYDSMGYSAFIDQDYETAAKYFSKGAELGGLMSKFYLGVLYLDGNVVQKDQTKGVALIKDAANCGYYAACYHLAFMYVNGYDVNVDLSQARIWIDKAIENGEVEDAKLLSIGINVISNNIQKNSAEGHFNAAMCYLNMASIGVNIVQGIKHLTESANRGYMMAQHNLGYIYGSKDYGIQDYPEAIKWYKKASAAGCADSQYNLFIHYSKGIGVAVDLAEAYKWCKLAAQNGKPEAIKVIKAYESQNR